VQVIGQRRRATSLLTSTITHPHRTAAEAHYEGVL
jgi:hypothetical protein